MELRFDIERFQVEGATLLAPEEISAATALFTGARRDFGDVQRALEALERAYTERGYSAVQIYLPEQALEKGVVRLRVVEARLRSIEVRQNKFFDTENVRASLPSLKEGEAPNADTIAANLRIVNENPAKQTTVLLRAGDKEGDVNALIDVADEDPTKWFATLDNTGTGATGYYRIGLGYQNANIANRDRALTLQAVTSNKPERVAIYSAGYHVPLYAHGASMDFVAGYSDVDVGTTATPAGPLQFSGRGSILLARYNRQLPRIPGYEHKLVLGVDRRAYRNTCSFGEFGEAGCGTAGATFSVTPLSAGYHGSRTLERGQVGFFATLARNAPMGSSGSAARLTAARPGTDADFTVLRVGGSHAHAFRNDWQTRIVALGQYTQTPLVPPEQFGAGGQNSVRGFYEREVSSDRGYSASFELYTPDLGEEVRLPDWNVRLLAFYDLAQVTRIDPAPGDVARERISSAGFGVRMGLKKHLSLRADVAHVLEPGGSRREGDNRLGFSVLWVF
ncbi:MAG: hypothetical protein A3G81_08310 [Betaproteobacteria bacterium RIFCSPLOWO2_12_FULL_65_14]|nr:MAG: hypothetical protein A3G81_08310 [Betaproteobacteria bacterium RIFCSPLOWO2_12_FULL_65_14]